MKNLKLLTLFLLGTFWVGSCAKEDISKSGFKLEESFEMKIGEAAHAQKEDLNIKINSVLEDSRCPIDALCAWEGQVKLEIEIAIGDQVFVEELIFLASRDLVLKAGSYIFQLIKVTPENQFDELIEPEDYTFTIIIKKD